MLGTTVIALCINAVLWVVTIILMIHYARLGKISHRQSMVNISNPTLPSVAIIIVAQEEGDKLRRHLPVFLEQKYPKEYQVIVVDIHSTDDTLKLLEQLEEQYPQLTHSSIPASARDISMQRLAMMLGMKTACTEWVVFTQADCCPQNDEWLATFMQTNTNGKNAIIGLTRYANCNNWLMRKRQFLRLWQQMLWIPFAENHHPYGADDTILAYRKSYFFEHNGFSSDSKLLAGAATLLVNKNISCQQCAVSVNQNAILVQDNPLPHTWLQERVFAIETRRQAKYKWLFRTWSAIKLLLPILYTVSTIIACIMWRSYPFVVAALAVLWISTHIIRDVNFNRTARQFNIKTYHIMLPFLCLAIPVWDIQAWIRWRFTNKRAFRKKFV
jgi:glycosyltransferase involved in cell wall biosynthesis